MRAPQLGLERYMHAVPREDFMRAYRGFYPGEEDGIPEGFDPFEWAYIGMIDRVMKAIKLKRSDIIRLDPGGIFSTREFYAANKEGWFYRKGQIVILLPDLIQHIEIIHEENRIDCPIYHWALVLSEGNLRQSLYHYHKAATQHFEKLRRRRGI
ncbi:MAG: hypothetical protein KJ709_04475 [Nanoarchaeota archaeon]|nr:hypothetical protein [Nanoarchaeota archaeon]